MNWLLPDYLADALPLEAAQIERLRRLTLDLYARHGFELVMPPLVEYLDSLLTGSGQDLMLSTCKLVDQLSGRTLGVRADMTPQVARIDAHLLNREGVVRLCYCDSILHALPADQAASREPIQLGAEIYGHRGVEADIEVIRLMAATLSTVGAPADRIDLSHVGVFRALTQAAGLTPESEARLFKLLQQKDATNLAAACADIAEPWRSAFLRLPGLYGDATTLARARRELPALPALAAALESLQRLADAMPELPLSFDLADLRGYHYHTGVVFAAFRHGFAGAVARGGRYDGGGTAFGRDRPATGFSLDLRELARLAPQLAPRAAIAAPFAEQAGSPLAGTIAKLRAAGEIVVEHLPGAAEDSRCDRRLVRNAVAGASGETDAQWIIEVINRG
ncbi:ATP phosphoribosyltransferase regulatory subunit [Rhodocyclus tenuis]|uniref:ATP phosphoribosyltransferase regulatory subunit n=2 Tax=Rhodocyclus TaxID=1064 RepID=A0A6L5JW03_RHOTE|nr:ATP phosphoribosyltransferase regulatory subunit [Rhodocyclus gracilis]MQY51241.1 ATP phosphoribosyltransferase regulatory subunit [Rhodocyclus gracilis]NJA89924.1 ATP phosphoribosyltransferase regulatory subunit [Rhodocyclus gracilis]